MNGGGGGGERGTPPVDGEERASALRWGGPGWDPPPGWGMLRAGKAAAEPGGRVLQPVLPERWVL